MPAPTTKADWIAKLKGVGINVPIEWNLIQIKAAWADYQETEKDSPAEIMKEELSGLKRASRKKADLQQYLQDMGVQVQSKETVAAMFSKGEDPEIRTDRQRDSGLWQVWDNDLR